MVNVLLVNDDPLQVNEYKERLEAAGHYVEVGMSFKSGQLLAAGRKTQTRFHVALLDIVMPTFDGETPEPHKGMNLAGFILEKANIPRIIMHSGNEEYLQNAREALSKESNDIHFVQKDFPHNGEWPEILELIDRPITREPLKSGLSR